MFEKRSFFILLTLIKIRSRDAVEFTAEFLGSNELIPTAFPVLMALSPARADESFVHRLSEHHI